MIKNTVLVNGGAMPKIGSAVASRDRRQFIGGSDARIIMGKDEKALARLWKEKRGPQSTLVRDQFGLPDCPSPTPRSSPVYPLDGRHP
jgi:hypothetical protein